MHLREIWSYENARKEYTQNTNKLPPKFHCLNFNLHENSQSICDNPLDSIKKNYKASKFDLAANGFFRMTRLPKVWIFGDLWCSIWLAVDVWMCTASILNLCAISLDRYLAVTRPVSYPQASTIYRLFDFVAQVCRYGNARWSHLSPPGSSLLFCSSVSILHWFLCPTLALPRA